MEKVDKIVIGGGMVFTFLKARGLETGSSLVEEDQLDLAKKLEDAGEGEGHRFHPAFGRHRRRQVRRRRRDAGGLG